ncbi:hypothetical protein HJC23_004048 [Cyclotella cryptica]|uniref:Uncharacterized protein n=1 Tax=Cyclotella cryptica TaxID=29204 RepID=A0ABD3QW09_9STRA|eukprot:CCRYP_002042-RA/>CCRYP_002042-RA protein AED:0.42 eAED:0.42 QI:0/-1/0/1/-1/1/1/0/242
MRTAAIIHCLFLNGMSTVFSFGKDSPSVNCFQRATSRCTPLNSDRSSYDFREPSVDDALILLNEAKALRAQASALQKQLNEEKEEKLRREIAKVDSLIDALLFHGTTNFNNNEPISTSTSMQTTGEEKRSKQQLMNTEERVAELLIQKRLSYDQVNQMFDRICELANRPQSIDSCSPLLSLLLDAACKVDCLEREDNPNKRWNHRVERDLRRKLFALGYGIRIEDVEKKKNVRSITGEKDYY